LLVDVLSETLPDQSPAEPLDGPQLESVLERCLRVQNVEQILLELVLVLSERHLFLLLFHYFLQVAPFNLDCSLPFTLMDP
jgi:hypothetical protein